MVFEPCRPTYRNGLVFHVDCRFEVAPDLVHVEELLEALLLVARAPPAHERPRRSPWSTTRPYCNRWQACSDVRGHVTSLTKLCTSCRCRRALEEVVAAKLTICTRGAAVHRIEQVQHRIKRRRGRRQGRWCGGGGNRGGGSEGGDEGGDSEGGGGEGDGTSALWRRVGGETTPCTLTAAAPAATATAPAIGRGTRVNSRRRRRCSHALALLVLDGEIALEQINGVLLAAVHGVDEHDLRALCVHRLVGRVAHQEEIPRPINDGEGPMEILAHGHEEEVL
jgi:hypothetical protein